jgi:3,4-dihydroxy-9,10-secoandrosta-1,3,5(10)-triene-9,17-dione 4,5-dioxygenase
MPASLAYLLLKSGDPAAWDKFLTETVGLAAKTVGETRYRMDDRDWRIGVDRADGEGIAALGVEFATSTELEACIDRLRAADHEAEDDVSLARERGVLRLYRVADPSGHPLELVTGRTLAYGSFVSPAAVSGFVTGERGNMGFGHAVLAASDVEQSRRFWVDLIGFHLTDTMHFQLAPGAPSKALYFLHADNPRHHSIALIEFPVPGGLVHFMVEANDIDDVGRFIDRCERDNVFIATRLGRHSNDRMISVYAVTPGGSVIEFGCDGLQIDWRNWIATNSLIPDLWGHKPPPASPTAP